MWARNFAVLLIGLSPSIRFRSAARSYKVVASKLWFHCAQLTGLMLLMGACLAFPQDKRLFSIDLKTKGYPTGKRWNPDSCPAPFMGYHAVRWLDAERILLAFNTSPVCSQDDHQYSLPSNLRLITIDLQGNVLHEIDVAYNARLDDDRDFEHNGHVWIGPQATVLVNIEGIPKGKVRVFTSDLQPIQEIDTDSYAIGGIQLEGVTADRKHVLFSGDNGIGKNRVCLMYAAVPLERASECSSEQLNNIKLQFEDLGNFRVPKNHDSVLLGSSQDYSRSAVFVVKQGNGVCQLAGLLCPLHGNLFIYERKYGSTLFRVSFPVYGRAALSTDGKHLATFINNKLEILVVQ